MTSGGGQADFYLMTVLCFLYKNIEKLKLTDQKLSQTFYFLMMIFFVSNTMLVGMAIKIFENEQDQYSISYANTFVLFCVRFISAIALHCVIFPEVRKGMVIMKYVNNHPESFRSSNIPFFIGLMQVWTAIFAEIVNIYFLTHQPIVEDCIIYFIAFNVVIELPSLYFEAIHFDNPMLEVFHTEVIFTNKSSNIRFRDRKCFHKVFRIIYKIVRGLYVSLIFYFAPFMVLVLQFFFAKEKVDSVTE